MIRTIRIELDDENITQKDIIDATGLHFGSITNEYTIDFNAMSKTVILYDPNRMGQGIEMEKQNDVVLLRLTLPSTYFEIILLYQIAQNIGNRFDIEMMYREDVMFSCLNENYIHQSVDQDIELSGKLLENMGRQLESQELEYYIIFGAFHPIYIDFEQYSNFESDIDAYEQYLYDKQKDYYVCATPRFYKRKMDGSIFGLYNFRENLHIIFPKRPFHFGKLSQEPDSFFVGLPDQVYVLFDDFVNNIEGASYDFNNNIYYIDENKMYEIAQNYNINIDTFEYTHTNPYLGEVIDNAYGYHGYKIKDMELNIDENNQYNHLAAFLNWAYDHQFIDSKIIEQCPEFNECEDFREILKDSPLFHGQLRTFHFNKQARPFVKEYYTFGKKGYPHDVDQMCEAFFGTVLYNSKEMKDEAYLFMDYDERYKKDMYEYIDEAWENFKMKNQN